MRLKLLLSTGLGAGYFPVAPGTVGSLVGLLLLWGLHAAGGMIAALAGWLLVTLLGFWAAGAAEKHFARRDPRPVVIDEISGQMLALLFLPPSPLTLVAGFLVFRLLDILKPYPAGRLEALPGGAGIMADDLAAAVYTNLLVRALAWAVLGSQGLAT